MDFTGKKVLITGGAGFVGSNLVEKVFQFGGKVIVFDDLFTGPIHGFENADDYYTRSSCKQYLGGILQPCLIVHAKDDPFMSPDIVPTPDELSNSTELAVSHNGGHAGFICGASPLTPRYWLEQRIPAYLEKYLASR